jgi:hypothetical protein
VVFNANLIHNVYISVVYKLRSRLWARLRIRASCLVNRDCAEASKLLDDFALDVLLLSGAFLAFRRANPTDKAH